MSGERKVRVRGVEVGSSGKKKPREGIQSFLPSHSPVSQNQPSTGVKYGHEGDLSEKTAEGGVVAAGIINSGKNIISDMRAFLNEKNGPVQYFIWFRN